MGRMGRAQGRPRRNRGVMKRTKDTQGRTLPAPVPYLGMESRPSPMAPPAPHMKAALLKCKNPPVHFYRYLYNTIGQPYFWVDRRKLSDAALAEIIQHPQVELYVLYADGCPAGIAELEF